MVIFFPEYHERISRQGIASLFFMGNIGALIYSGDYFSPNPNPLVHLWSLAVEAQIYFALPLLLIAFLKIKIKIETTLFYLTVVSVMFFSLPFVSEAIVAWFGFPNKDQASFYLSFDRFWQFSIGGFCGILNLSRLVQIFKSKRNYYSVILISSVIIFLEIDNQKIGSVFATFLAVTLIMGQKFDYKNFQWFIWIGDRSYSLYLIHMPIFAVMNYSPVTTYLIGNNRLLHFVVGLILTFLLSNINYYCFEQRYRLNSSRLKGVRVKFIITGICFCICLGLSVSLNISAASSVERFNALQNVPTVAWDLDPGCDRMTNTGPPCFYNLGDGNRTTLLLGDSHAAQYSQALVDLGSENKFQVIIWTQASCPFTLNFSNKNLPKNCLKKNIMKMDWIAKNKPDNVIVSYFGIPDLDALKEVAAQVKNVILIEDNPVFPDTDEFLQQLPIVMKPYSNPKSFRLQDMNLENSLAMDALYAEVRKIGISTIGLSSQICKNGICSRWSNGEWLYSDDNHLSTIGAELLKPLLSKALKK